MSGTALSPLHRIVEALGSALSEIGSEAGPGEVEARGIALHEALSSRARQFHTHWHVLGLLPGADATAVLAALYHDVVYVQVDLGLPAAMEELLGPLLAKEDDGWRILAAAERDPATRDVLALFGRRAGELLDPFGGLNELASALVAVKALEPALTREQRLAVVAAIEQTVPFREAAAEALAERLAALGVEDEVARRMVVRGVCLANRDVGNFAVPEVERFLDHTWRLLPETNPALHSPALYAVRDYRVALTKTEGFLATLRADRVFHAWGGEPDATEHGRRITATRRNLAVAVRYLRARLFSISVLEAIAEESGGGAPLEYFMGGIADPGEPPFRRIEQFLPAGPSHPDVDAALLRLLEEGRTRGTGSDTVTSPLAGFLYRGLGEVAVMAGLEQARKMWAGALAPGAFLAGLPAAYPAALARAAAEVATTRRVALLRLVERLADTARAD